MNTENIEVNLSNDELVTIVKLYLDSLSQATQDHIDTNFYSIDFDSLKDVCYAMVINEGVNVILSKFVEHEKIKDNEVIDYNISPESFEGFELGK